MLFVFYVSEVSAKNVVASSLTAGDHDVTLKYQDKKRHYLLHLPPQISEKKNIPVILNFHGGGGKAKRYQSYTGMDKIADEVGFIVIYPDGTSFWGRRLESWNAGKCCGYANKNEVDDVGFVRAIIDDISSKIAIDRNRVYATGYSNGAMMAYRLAVEAGDVIAAIAPVAGAMMVDSFTPTTPVPVLHIHSIDDPRALYKGGLGPRFPYTTKRVNHESVERSIKNWAIYNQCAPQAKPKRDLFGANGTAMAGQSATLFVYDDCKDGKEVALWQLREIGHVWPGGEQGYKEDLLGPSTKVIDANREIWQFFSRFSLNQDRQQGKE